MSGILVVSLSPVRGVSRFLLPGLLASLVLLAVSSAQAAPGALDTSFGTGGKVITTFGPGTDPANAVAVQPDGRLVVAGAKQSDTGSDFALARYRANGRLDRSFGAGGKVVTSVGPEDDGTRALALQPDGKIVVAGFRDPDFALARYKRNGKLDRSFGRRGKTTTAIGSQSSAYALALQPDGKAVAAGYSYNGTEFDFALVRYRRNGKLDRSFGVGGKVTTALDPSYRFNIAEGVAVQPDGKIVAVGVTSQPPDFTHFAVVRYNPNGSLDMRFGAGGKIITKFGTPFDTAHAVALQRNGKIVVAGDTSSLTNGDFAIVRYNRDGTLDMSFGTEGKTTTSFGPSDDVANAVALQLNGRIVVAGWSHGAAHCPVHVRPHPIQPERLARSELRDRRAGHHGIRIGE